MVSISLYLMLEVPLMLMVLEFTRVHCLIGWLVSTDNMVGSTLRAQSLLNPCDDTHAPRKYTLQHMGREKFQRAPVVSSPPWVSFILYQWFFAGLELMDIMVVERARIRLYKCCWSLSPSAASCPDIPLAFLSFSLPEPTATLTLMDGVYWWVQLHWALCTKRIQAFPPQSCHCWQNMCLTSGTLNTLGYKIMYSMFLTLKNFFEVIMKIFMCTKQSLYMT